MEEQYKIITGFSNYEILNFGNVRNINTGKILKQSINTSGYKSVNIISDVNGKFFLKRVHRLVAEMFILNQNNKKSVDHIDNDKANNNVNNLRWVTPQENSSNRTSNINNSSGFKGVGFEQNKWRAQITYNKKKLHLGYFDNKIDAIKARINKSKELFGEYMNKCENIDIEELELEELDKELTRLINS